MNGGGLPEHSLGKKGVTKRAVYDTASSLFFLQILLGGLSARARKRRAAWSRNA